MPVKTAWQTTGRQKSPRTERRRPSLGRIGAEDRHEPNDPPVLVLYRVRVRALFPIRYSIRAVQQDSAFKMTHIEAKSINIWLRYDPKHLVSILGHISAKG